MEETRPWRDELGKIINDPQERQRIASSLHVHPITLTRWITRKSTPRRESLRTLLKLFPEYYQRLFPSLKDEFPDFFLEDTSSEHLVPEIPPAFYARVFKTFITSPPLLRTSTICRLVLQQIIGHLDPHQSGLAAVIAECVPPAKDKKVRCLRITEGRGTPPWQNVENYTMFLGAESPVGYALRLGRLINLQGRDELGRWFSPPYQTHVESAVFCPLLQYDCAAGCLCIGSTRAYNFSPTHLDLIQSYADLLLIGFEQHNFYPLDDITLGLMPPFSLQQPLFARFQQRVIECMLRSSNSSRPPTRTQAESLVWQEVAEELLHYPALHESQPEQLTGGFS